MCKKDSSIFIFFFQAEDGIRDATVTGVQTCALPILAGGRFANDQSYNSARPCGSVEAVPSSNTEPPMSAVTDVPAFARGGAILSAHRAVAIASARQPATRPSRLFMVSPSE